MMSAFERRWLLNNKHDMGGCEGFTIHSLCFIWNSLYGTVGKILKKIRGGRQNFEKNKGQGLALGVLAWKSTSYWRFPSQILKRIREE